MPEQSKRLLDYATRLRNEPTPLEVRMWAHLRGSQCDGYKFRRQHVIDAAIVDFFCPQKSLIVELDGDTHDVENDKRRDPAMAQRGYRTVRYTNSDVATNIEGVLSDLLANLRSAPDRWSADFPTPTPPLKGRGYS